MKPWKMLLAIAGALMFFALPCHAGTEYFGPPIRLWAGNADTLENATRWFPTRGLHRVVFRVLTSRGAQGAYAATDNDSLFSDSIATWKVLLSDSVSFMGRDSSGTLVTARSTSGFSASNAFPVCADSFVVDRAVQTFLGADTTFKLVLLSNSPINHILRAPATGSGVYSYVSATAPTSIGTYGDGAISSQYMRIRFTALKRLTPNTASATSPTRVRGLKGLVIEAIPVYRNH